MRRFILIIMLVASLSLNLATVTISAVATAISSVVEALTGTASVFGAMRRDLALERKRSSDLALEVVDAKSTGLRTKKEADTLKQQLDFEKRRSNALDRDLVKARTVTIKGKTKPIAEVVEETTERVARRTARGASRNVASTFGEAVPLYGIGVVIAATAWELKDACDTMKDLHELDLAFNPGKAPSSEVTEVCGLKVPTKDELWGMIKSSPGKAYEIAKGALPDLPAFETPSIDWKFWE
jgi:hypothetical protein